MTINSASPLHPYWIDFSSLYQRANAISHAYSSGNFVFFVGSGASKYFSDSMPSWSELLTNLLAEVHIDNHDEKEQIKTLISNKRYVFAAEAIKLFATLSNKNKELGIDEIVSKIIKKRQNASSKNLSLHQALLDFSVPIITTNYDTIIEDAILECKAPNFRRNAITFHDEEEIANLLTPTKVHENYVYKIHGSIDQSKRLILDEKDYTDFYFQTLWPTSLQLIRHLLSTKMVVFVGFSLSDPEIMLILREATRFSSAYQHIALMYEPELATIEKEIIKSNYGVDLITFNDYKLLPLLIMEMKNLFPKNNLSLTLSSTREKLEELVEHLKNKNIIREKDSVVLFGSYSKYGTFSADNSDIDLFIMTPASTVRTPFQRLDDKEILNKRIDIVKMSREDFEARLYNGEPFASSILVTGCPLQDPLGQYRILANGFEGFYFEDIVLRTVVEDLTTVWLRLSTYENREDIGEYLQACHRWSHVVMQYYIFKDYYPIDSLLSISLLGNSRFTQYEFSKRFPNVDEEYFNSVANYGKGDFLTDSTSYPSMLDITYKLASILINRFSISEIEFLLPNEFISKASITMLIDIYKETEWYIDKLFNSILVTGGGYDVTTYNEKELLNIFSETKKIEGEALSMMEYLFFFRLHGNVIKDGNSIEHKEADDDMLSKKCVEVRKKFLEDISIFDLLLEKK